MSIDSRKRPDLDAASSCARADPLKALDICDQFASQNPENYKLHLVRIRAHTVLGNLGDAAQCANDYVKFRPDHPQPYWERAEAEHRLGKYNQSNQDIYQAVSLDKDKFLGTIPDRLMALNHAYMGDMDQAMQYVHQVEEVDGQKWFPPGFCLPSGTMHDFKNHLQQVAQRANTTKDR